MTRGNPRWVVPTVLVLAGVLLGCLRVDAGAHPVGPRLSLDRTSTKELYANVESGVSMSDMKARLKEKMAVLSEGDIKAAIDAAIEETGAERDLVLRAVYISSRWGRLESLDEVRKHLVDRKQKVYSSGTQASLADVMVYLYVKKCEVRGAEWYTERWEDSNVALLLDDVTLRRLGREVETMVKSGATVVAPWGWMGGLTVFSQSRYIDVIKSIALRTRQAQDSDECKLHVGAGGSDAVDCVVSLALRSADAWSDVGARKEWIDQNVEWIGKVEASELPGRYDEGAIAENLEPAIDYDFLERSDSLAEGCLFQPPEGDTAGSWPTASRLGTGDYLRYLMEFGTIVSMNRLAQYVKSSYDLILERFPDEAGERVYCVPEKAKSTVVVYHLFMMVTNEHPSQLKYCSVKFRFNEDDWDWAANFRGKAGLNIFLVDDLSISGQQQAKAYEETKMILSRVMKRSRRRNTHVWVVPLIYSTEAVRVFRRSSTRALSGGPLYRDGGRGSWMLEYGFKGRSNIVIPYMSPDNNNLFFAQYVAKAFTFKKCGVKRYTEVNEFTKQLLDPGCKDQARRNDMGLDTEIIACLGDKQVSAAAEYCYQSLRSASDMTSASTEEPEVSDDK